MFSVLHDPASQAKNWGVWAGNSPIFVYRVNTLGLCMLQARFTAKRRLVHVEATEVRHIVDSEIVPQGAQPPSSSFDDCRFVNCTFEV